MISPCFGNELLILIAWNLSYKNGRAVLKRLKKNLGFFIGPSFVFAGGLLNGPMSRTINLERDVCSTPPVSIYLANTFRTATQSWRIPAIVVLTCLNYADETMKTRKHTAAIDADLAISINSTSLNKSCLAQQLVRTERS